MTMAVPVLAPSHNSGMGLMNDIHVGNGGSLAGSYRQQVKPSQQQQSYHNQPGQLFGASPSITTLKSPPMKNGKIPATTASSTRPAKPSKSGQHGKLHKRAVSSISSTSSVESPTSVLQQSGSPSSAGEGQRLVTSPLTVASSASSSGAPSKIKPYLRKLSSREPAGGSSSSSCNNTNSKNGTVSNAIDLSRPAAENESLAGLGITDYGVEARSAQDVSFTALGRRTRHARSTSNNSQFSTASSAVAASSTICRPTAQYVHPMRQTPRPYTPPIGISSSQILPIRDRDDAVINETDIDKRQSQIDREQSRSISSTPTFGMHLPSSSSQPGRMVQQQPAASATAPSSTRLDLSRSALAVNQSQTSIIDAGTPRTRSRGNTLLSIDTMTVSGTATTPSSRTSLDRALSFIRGRERDAGAAAQPVTDPTDKRAASIRAARQAYRAKEEVKARKAEKTLLRKEEKHLKRRLKREEAEQRQRMRRGLGLPVGEKTVSGSGAVGPSAEGRNAVGAMGLGGGAMNRTGMGGVGSGNSSSPPSKEKSHFGRAKGEGGGGPMVPAGRPVRSRWLAFVTWLRTRLLKLGRRMKVA